MSKSHFILQHSFPVISLISSSAQMHQLDCMTISRSLASFDIIRLIRLIWLLKRIQIKPIQIFHMLAIYVQTYDFNTYNSIFGFTYLHATTHSFRRNYFVYICLFGSYSMQLSYYAATFTRTEQSVPPAN